MDAIVDIACGTELTVIKPDEDIVKANMDMLTG